MARKKKAGQPPAGPQGARKLTIAEWTVIGSGIATALAALLHGIAAIIVAMK